MAKRISTLVLTLKTNEKECRITHVIAALRSHAEYLSSYSGIGRKGRHQATDQVTIDWEMERNINKGRKR